MIYENFMITAIQLQLNATHAINRLMPNDNMKLITIDMFKLKT